MPAPTLYGHPLSLYTRKARLALLFQGVEHQLSVVPPHSDDQGFCAASPLRKIPAFCDDQTAFADSTVIAHYVNKFYPGRSLIPETPDAYAKTLWFEEYSDTIMAPAVGPHLFAEVVLAQRVFQREPIQADIDKAIGTELPAIYTFLEGQVGEGGWLLGADLTLADIAVGTMMMTAAHCGQFAPESAPKLSAYVDRFLALPEVRQVLAEEIGVMKAIGYDSPLAARL